MAVTLHRRKAKTRNVPRYSSAATRLGGTSADNHRSHTRHSKQPPSPCRDFSPLVLWKDIQTYRQGGLLFALITGCPKGVNHPTHAELRWPAFREFNVFFLTPPQPARVPHGTGPHLSRSQQSPLSVAVSTGITIARLTIALWQRHPSGDCGRPSPPSDCRDPTTGYRPHSALQTLAPHPVVKIAFSRYSYMH